MGSSVSQQVLQQFHKDDAAFRRLVQRASALGVAFDEGEVEELTTEQLAAKVLRKLGLDTPHDGTAVAALEHWLAGNEHANDRLKGRVRGALDRADEPQWFTDITKAR